MSPAAPLPFERAAMLVHAATQAEPFDLLIIGGGATGAYVALDAASRGLRVALLEQHDFGKGTSSRSTKLVHGGVRYLAQGNIMLVRDALYEQSLLIRNAPHLVRELSLIVPCSAWWERWWYGIGFRVYRALAGTTTFAKARSLSADACLQRIPTLAPQRARGGVLYSDGQFDDSRLLLNLLQSAAERGAAIVNYAEAIDLTRNDGGILDGVRFRDRETDQCHTLRARCIVNATGPFCDRVRRMATPDAQAMVAASQGVHIVLPATFLPGETAIIVPKTSDGRVLFLIPWHDRVVVGTTDTPIPNEIEEPTAQHGEIEFLLRTAGEYLARRPGRSDVLSVFVGIRPLVQSQRSGTKSTAKLSRDHTIEVSENGLVTITGGKWTTARHMAEDCVNRVLRQLAMPPRPCITQRLAVHGSPAKPSASPHAVPYARSVLGTDLAAIEALIELQPALGRPIAQDFPWRYAEIVWAVRHEMARTLEDVLARRTRLLFLDANAAIDAAPEVANFMAKELGRSPEWVEQQLEAFLQLAQHYRCPTTSD